MGDIAFEVNPISSDVPEWMERMCNSFLNTKEAKRCFREVTAVHPWAGYEPTVSLQVGFTAIFDKSIYFPPKSDEKGDDEESFLADLLNVDSPKEKINNSQDVGPQRGSLNRMHDATKPRIDVQDARQKMRQIINQHADKTKSPDVGPQQGTFNRTRSGGSSQGSLNRTQDVDPHQETFNRTRSVGSSQGALNRTQDVGPQRGTFNTTRSIGSSQGSLNRTQNAGPQLGALNRTHATKPRIDVQDARQKMRQIIHQHSDNTKSPTPNETFEAAGSVLEKSLGSDHFQPTMTSSPNWESKSFPSLSGSDHSHSTSPQRRSRSPQRRSRSPQRRSRSPSRRITSSR